MPCWRVAHNVINPYQGVKWIHPLKQHSVELFLNEIKKYDSIEYVIIFGSSVEERCTTYSDVDIFIKGARDIRFKCPLIDDFDIIHAEGMSSRDPLWGEIVRDGVCIYEKNVDGIRVGDLRNVDWNLKEIIDKFDNIDKEGEQEVKPKLPSDIIKEYGEHDEIKLINNMYLK